MVDRISFPGFGLSANIQSLARHSVVIAELETQTQTSASPEGEISFPLPSWVTKPVLEQYLSYAQSDRVPKMDFNATTEMVRLAAFLQDSALEKTLFSSNGLNGFTKETIVPLFNLAAEMQSRSTLWTEYYRKALIFASANLSHLLEHSRGLLIQTQPQALEELLLEALKSDFGRPSADHSIIIKVLKALWKSSTLVQMLEKAEKRAKENSTFLSPVLTWNLTLIPSTQLYESQAFEVDGLIWELKLWYYQKEDRLDCFLVSKSAGKVHAPGALAAVSVGLSLFPEDYFNESRVVTILLGAKGQKLVKSVFGVKTRVGTARISLKANVRIEYLYSALFTHLATHFEDLQTSEKTGKLSGERVLQLLSMKQLNVSSEDVVLKLLGQWSERHRRVEDLQLQLEALSDGVRWDYVSVKCLVDCCRLYPVLKTSGVFRKALANEFEVRGRGKPRRGLVHVPRPAYSGKAHETEANLTVFLSDLCAVLVEFDYTPANKSDDQQQINTLRGVLREREQQAKQLKDSLGLLQRVVHAANTIPSARMSLSAAPSPVRRKADPADESGVSRLGGLTLSTAIPKSQSRHVSIDETADFGADGRVTDLLSSFWLKLEEKAKVDSGDSEHS